MPRPVALAIPSLVAIGAWLGFADGFAALLRDADVAGRWLDRAGTLVASVLAAAAGLPLLVGGVRLMERRFAARPSRHPGARAVEALSIAGAVAVLVAGPNARQESAGSLVLAAAVGLVCAAAAARGEDAIRRLARSRDRESRLAAALGLAALALAPPAAWTGPAPSRAPGARSPGLVLVSVDTLRPHHLGAYGYARATSPHLDALAREGTLFEKVFAQAPWTLPSHATMLTGLGPLVHGALEPGDTLAPSLPTLAERLRAHGFRTAAFVGGNRHSFIGAERGFGRGFETYRHYPHPARFRSGFLLRFLDHLVLRQLRHHVGNAEAETDAALRWLARRGDEPFFLWLHFYDVHSKTQRLPYEAPDPWRDAFCGGEVVDSEGCDAEGRCASERLRAVWVGESPRPEAGEIERLRCLYDGAIAFVDAQLGRLFHGLDRLGLREGTLIAVTSDHGEAFFEHGHPLHTNLYDEVLQVPLILRGPGVPAGLRVAETARLVDLVPTLLDRLDLPVPDGLQGRNLFAGGGAPIDLAVGSSDSDSIALRAGAFKFVIYRPTAIAPGHALPAESLFDLQSDPGETRNLLEGRPPEIAAELRERLQTEASARRALGRRLRAGEARVAVELSERERAALEALGYVVPDRGLR